MKESEELIEAAIAGDIVRIKSCVENGDRLNDDLDEIYQKLRMSGNNSICLKQDHLLNISHQFSKE